MLTLRKKLIFSVATCLIVIVPIVVVLSGIYYFQFCAGHNFDFEFGYYGSFNRFQHVIETMPNVTIIDQWQHQDVSLEDFGFTLLVDGEQKIQLDIRESDPIRDETDKQKIKAHVESEIRGRVQSVNGE